MLLVVEQQVGLRAEHLVPGRRGDLVVVAAEPPVVIGGADEAGVVAGLEVAVVVDDGVQQVLAATSHVFVFVLNYKVIIIVAVEINCLVGLITLMEVLFY